MITLILAVVMCSGTGQTVAECEPSNLALYDSQVWIGPTEDDMRDCLEKARTLTFNGNNARCEIADGDQIKTSAAPNPVPAKWTF